MCLGKDLVINITSTIKGGLSTASVEWHSAVRKQSLEKKFPLSVMFRGVGDSARASANNYLLYQLIYRLLSPLVDCLVYKKVRKLQKKNADQEPICTYSNLLFCPTNGPKPF